MVEASIQVQGGIIERSQTEEFSILRSIYLARDREKLINLVNLFEDLTQRSITVIQRNGRGMQNTSQVMLVKYQYTQNVALC